MWRGQPRGHKGCCFLATEMAKESREESAIRKHTPRNVVDVLMAMVSGGGGLLVVGSPPFSGVCRVVCICPVEQCQQEQESV